MSFKFKGLSPANKMRARRIYDEEVERAAESASTLNLVECLYAVVCETLADEFGWGDVRLNRFRKRLAFKIECIASDHVDYESIKENLNVQTIVVKDKKIYRIDDEIREIKKKEIEEMKARRNCD